MPDTTRDPLMQSTIKSELGVQKKIQIIRVENPIKIDQ